MPYPKFFFTAFETDFLFDFHVVAQEMESTHLTGRGIDSSKRISTVSGWQHKL